MGPAQVGVSRIRRTGWGKLRTALHFVAMAGVPPTYQQTRHRRACVEEQCTPPDQESEGPDGVYDGVVLNNLCAASSTGAAPLSTHHVSPPPAPPQRLPLVRQLYHAHAWAGRPRPQTKELHEGYAFFKRTEGLLARGRPLDVVVDACGGHGMLGMPYVAYGKARRAIIVDVCKPASHVVMLRAWARFLPPGSVTFVQEDIVTALPRLLTETASGQGNGDGTPPVGSKSILAEGKGVGFCDGTTAAVVACHACAHLTRAVIDAATRAGVLLATMACCHSKKTQGAQVWRAAQDLGLPLGECPTSPFSALVSKRSCPFLPPSLPAPLPLSRTCSFNLGLALASLEYPRHAIRGRL